MRMLRNGVDEIVDDGSGSLPDGLAISPIDAVLDEHPALLEVNGIVIPLRLRFAVGLDALVPNLV
jgi:hypothetical protein